jgi:hypothetical protein
MTKKIIGICLIIIGLTVITVYVYNLIQMVSQPGKIMMKTEQQLVVKGYSQQQIDASMSVMKESMKTLKIIDSIIAFIGIGIAFGGFILFKRGNKDTRLSSAFKFD